MPQITAIVNDLNFMTRIRNTAESFGLTVGFVGSKDQIDYYLKDCDLLIIDLENDFIEPVELIERIKCSKATASIKLIGYVSHVNTPLKTHASAAGCDEVLSRFEFNSNLKEIMQAACC
jgi:CheY-like chemotaxis protein